MARKLVPLALAALAAAAAWFAGETELVRKAELYLLDARYVVRNLWPLTPVPVGDDLVIVTLDDRTYREYERADAPDRVGRHSVFWAPLYARAMAGALEAGATVAALDVIPQYVDEEAYLAFAGPLLPHAQAGRVLLTGYLEIPRSPEEEVRLVMPPGDYSSLLQDPAGGRNLCLNNLTADGDGVVRALPLRPLRFEETRVEERLPSLGVRLAEKHAGRSYSPVVKEGEDPEAAPPPGDVTLLDGARVLINFAGPPRQVFPAVSLALVLDRIEAGDRDWLRRTFRGKAVVVAPWAGRDQDLAITPFHLLEVPPPEDAASLTGTLRVLMPGVEVHAHLANTLLTGAFIRKPGTAPLAALLLLVTALAASMAGRVTARRGVIFGALVVGAWVATAFLAFSAAWTWLPIMPVVLAVPSALVLTYAWHFWFEERQAREVRGLFGRYVSPDVMEELLQDPSKQALGATGRREITVLFTDINGFSTLVEKHTPDEVIGMLNRYFAEMTAVIFRHQGTIKQFVGDEILAFYGAPRAHPEPERAAVLTALEMISRLRELGQGDPTGEGGFYSCKVGIHTGQVIVGNVGSAERSEYAAVGDDVNLGSRIMGMTKSVGADILISGATYERVRGMEGVEFIPHGEREVKGRVEKVSLYEVRPVGRGAGAPGAGAGPGPGHGGGGDGRPGSGAVAG